MEREETQMIRKVKSITAWLLIVVLFININSQSFAAAGEAVRKQSDYQDIHNHWAKDAIERLIQENIVHGITNNGKKLIEPERNITRSEFIKITLSSIYTKSQLEDQVKAVTKDICFSDISNHWAKDYIILAHQLGIIDGYLDGTFKPDDPITRSEAVKIIVTSNSFLNNCKISNKMLFSDVNEEHWAYKYIQVAKENQLISGYSSNQFKPNHPITRAEGIVVADRFIDYICYTSFNENLKSIKVETDTEQTNIGSTVTFTFQNNSIEDKLQGLRRQLQLNYKIILRDNNKTIAEIQPGQKTLELKLKENLVGSIFAQIVPLSNGIELVSTTHQQLTETKLLTLLNIEQESNKDNKGVVHNLVGHDTVIPHAPAAPIVTSELIDGNVTLTWNSMSEADTTYTIKRGEKSGNYTPLATITGTTYTDASRVPNTTYYYVVTATNTAGTSPNSNEIVYKTVPQEPNLFGSMEATTGNISWTYSNGANYYALYRSTVSGGPYYPIVENTINNNYQDTGLNETVTYYYVVKAINEIGESRFSNEIAIGGQASTGYVFNPSIDEDNDGLNNDEEILIGTKTYQSDTDQDGLLDGREIELGTNPLDPDTDGDGTYDGAEQVLGTDPLTTNTTSRATKEAQTQNGAIKVVANGDGNLVIAPLQVEEVDNVILEFLDGTIGKPIEITSGGFDIDNASIEFTYDEAELKGVEESDLAIFYVNPNTMQLEALENIIVNTDTNTIRGITTHFSMYLLGDKNMEVDLSKIDIVFTIDQSGSMGWNDPNNYRISATERFVEDMDETKNRVGLVPFTFSAYVESVLTNDKNDLLTKLASMRNYGGGTDIADGIKTSTQLFEDEVSNMRVIILLTDGQSSREPALDEADKAAAQSVIINTVALGSDADTELLEQIAAKTKGGYFYINDEGNLSQEDVDKQIELIYQKLAKQLAFTSIAEDNDALPQTIVNMEFSDLYKGYESKEIEDWITNANTNLLTGNYIYQNTDIALDGPGFNITLDRTYNSFSTEAGLFGVGFNSNIESKIEKNDSNTYGTVTASLLNVRSSAGVTSSNRIGQLSKGTEVEILDRHAGGTYAYPWYKIKYKNKDAYVAGWYITEKEALHLTYPSGTKIVFNYNTSKTEAVSSSSDDKVYINRHPTYKYEVVRKDQSAYYYDDNGIVKAYTDRYGNSITFQFNNKNQMIKITGAFANRYLTLSYNSQGLISQVSDPLGRITTYDYDANKRLITYQDMNGQQTHYTYDNNHKINKILDAKGHQIVRNDYDILGRLVRQYDGKNHIKYTIYDDNIDQENSISARYAIDENGNESKVTFGPGMKPMTIRDAKGGTTEFTYYYKNEETNTWEDISTDIIIRNGSDVEYTESYKKYQEQLSQGNVELREVAKVTRNIDTYGHENSIILETTTDRDKNGNIVAVTDAYGDTEITTYDDYSNRVSHTDKKGNTTTYHYDNKVYLSKVIDPLGNTTRYDYYELDYSKSIVLNGLLKTETDEAGDVTLYQYKNGNNFLDTITDAEGYVTTMTYDIAGRKLTETDANGHTTSYTYDNMNRLLEVKNPYGKTLSKTYDAVGNLIQETDYEGHITKYTYDEINRLTSVIDALGSTTAYTYDPSGNKLKEIHPNGGETQYQYDALHRVTEEEDALGYVTKYTYDSVGNIIKESDPLNRETNYIYDKLNQVIIEAGEEGKIAHHSYDSNGNIIALEDALGYRTTYDYDELNRQTKVTDALGNDEITTYLDKENKIIVTDKLGRQTIQQLDGLDRVIKTIDPLNQTETFTYDGNGNVLTKTNVLGTISTYIYDKLNQSIQETITYDPIYIVNSEGNVTTSSGQKVQKVTMYTYDNNGNQLSQTDAEGHTTSYTYDALNQLTNIIYADQSTYGYHYDTMGQVIREIYQNGYEKNYEYDLLSRKTKELDAEGNTTSYSYDKAGNVIMTIDANGNNTYYTYDDLNRLVKEKDANGHQVSMSYDVLGNNISKTDKNGYTTTYEYDALSRLLKTTDPYGNKTVTTYDAVDNPITIMDAKNNVESNTYDELNRKVAMEDPTGEIETYRYDAIGNLISKTNKNGNKIGYTYNDLSQLVGVTEPDGTITQYTFDFMGNVTSQTDGKGQATKYVYNERYQTIKRIDPLGGEETYTYDPVGNMISKTDRNNKTLTFTYYKNNLLQSESVGSLRYDYTYDGVGHLLTADDTGGTTQYIYDRTYNLISESLSDGKCITYTYDPNSNKLSMTDITGEQTSYTYDKMNRMETVTTADGTNTYTYDEIGNRSQLELANGSFTKYAFDEKNQLTKMENYVLLKDDNYKELVQASTTTAAVHLVIDKNVATTTSKIIEIVIDEGSKTTTASAIVISPDSLLSTGLTDAVHIDTTGHVIEVIDGKTYLKSIYTYTYDAEGYQVSKTEPKGTTTFTYDKLGRLEEVQEPDGRVTTYTYDLAGNRAMQTVNGNSVNSTINYTYDRRNRLLKTVENRNDVITITDYTYDNNGNQIRVDKTTDGKTLTTSYDYDDYNQLIKTTTAQGKVIQNTYNYKGLRNSKTVDGHTTNLYYDGEVLNAEVTTQGAIKYILGVNIIGTQGEDTLYYLYNGHADVVGMVNSDGIITNQYDYDVFGNIILSSEGFRNASKYSGYYYDEETGYYYLKARYCDPNIARFITEDSYLGNNNDPLSLNLYTYCKNNPIFYVDPSGHMPKWLENTWKHLTEEVQWKEVGLGTVQFFGGIFEAGAGFSIATATSATGVGIAGGVYIMVDGSSNVSGGASRVWNGFTGNKKGDTGNFVKNGYKDLSSKLGINSKYGEMVYNGTQLTIGLYSLGTGIKQLPGKAIEKSSNFYGWLNIEKGAETFTHYLREGNIISKTVYTQTGLVVKSTTIDLSKMGTGISLIGLDAYNISTLFDNEEEEDNEDKD